MSSGSSERKDRALKSWVKVFLVIALVAVPVMALGRVIWPPAADNPEPTAGQLPLFVSLAATEVLIFGLGVSSLLSGIRPASPPLHRVWLPRYAKVAGLSRLTRS